jgi:hypothetical protein
MSQLYTVSAMPSVRRRQTGELNARLGLLPSMLSQQNQKQFQEAQIADMAAKRKIDEARFGIEQGQFGLAQEAATFQNTRFGWDKQNAEKAQDLQTETQQREMGVKAAGLGFTGLSSGAGSFKMGDLGGKASSLWSGLFGGKPQVGSGVTGYGGEETPGVGGNASSGGTFSDMPIGAMGMGGLAGFAGGQLLGGKSKPMKALIGGGIGAGVGYFAGDGGWAGALGGGLLGGLGGLF